MSQERVPGGKCAAAGLSSSTNKLTDASLSALMLSRMKMGVNEAIQQYSIIGNGVFAQPRPQITSVGGFLKPKYASKKMEDALRQVIRYGSEKEMRRTGHSDIRLRTENKDACHT
jgi:hypothetical protein